MRLIKFAQPLITEEEKREVMKVLDGPTLTHGLQVESFEREFAEYLGGGVECVAVSSCWAALYLAMQLQAVKEYEWDVLTPAMSHVAGAHAILQAGGNPVFVDCEVETGNVTADNILRALTPNTVAISLVHFLGTPCELDAIYEIADEHNISVIEDCAIALGSRYKDRHVGTRSLGCFSFYPSKMITTGEGGMLVCADPDDARIARRLRGFGANSTYERRVLPGQYDVTNLGINGRMSELQAALGRTQLRHVEEWKMRRGENWLALDYALPITTERLIPFAPSSSSGPYCFEVLLDSQSQRDTLARKLKEYAIETSVYYPCAIPDFTYYQEQQKYRGHFPNARRIAATGLALPIGPHLHNDDMVYIADIFSKVMKGIL